MKCKNLIKYLDQYAENNVTQLGTHLADLLPHNVNFEHVVVIPAYKESPQFVARLLSSPVIVPVLYIIVINQPDSDVDSSPQINLYNFIKSSGTSIFKEGEIELISASEQTYFLIVDAFTHPLPVDQGVGLARKIGSDYALCLINKNKVLSDWIHSTDADAHLPEGYFEATSALSKQKKHNQTVAVSYNFTHVDKNIELQQANKLYETALRYYVAGLSYAGSDYDFFTIGSVIAFKAKEYAMVRGFPKRSAGEDFYLLNKLAKLGQVKFLKNAVVTIEARVSDRVPFGTGPSVANILQLKQDNKPYCYYHPQVFEELKNCIRTFDTLWENRFNLDDWTSALSKESQHALQDIKLASFVDKQKNNNQIQFNKQLTVWFDAFKTLKFIHSLREQKYADIPLQKAIESAGFTFDHY
ncbi:hypothetical protein ACM9HF_01925 [Colwellia sp. RE-S-Sl-9]